MPKPHKARHLRLMPLEVMLRSTRVFNAVSVPRPARSPRHACIDAAATSRCRRKGTPAPVAGGGWGIQAPQTAMVARRAHHEPAPGNEVRLCIPCGMRLVKRENSGFGTCVFQSPHPLRDATFATICVTSCATYFNPHTPCEMRRLVGDVGHHCHLISIPTPHAGCDSSGTFDHISPSSFQSPHPLRDATATIMARPVVVAQHLGKQELHACKIRRGDSFPAPIPVRTFLMHHAHPMLALRHAKERPPEGGRRASQRRRYATFVFGFSCSLDFPKNTSYQHRKQ